MKRPESILLGLVLAATAGCSSLSDQSSPAPLRVVIVDPEIAYESKGKAGPEADRDYCLAETIEISISADLIRKLKDLNAVVAVTGEENRMMRERADVVIRPVLTKRPAIRERWGGGWVSSLFWLMLYVPGWTLDDREYELGDFEVIFEFAPGGTTGIPFHEKPLKPSNVKLDFYDRSCVFSWQALCSLVYPPCLLPSNEREEIDRIADATTTSLAEGLASFLQSEFEQVSLERGEGSMGLKASLDGNKLTIQGQVSSRKREIDKFFVVINGEIVIELKTPEIKNEVDRRGTYSVDINKDTVLTQAMTTAVKDAQIRVRARAESVFSRTLVLTPRSDSPGK